MLSKLEDLTEFKWIRENIEAFPTKKSDWQGTYVTHYVPKLFSDYCKIFHAMYVDSKYADTPKVTWAEIARNERKLKSKKKDSPLDKLLSESTVSSIGVPKHGFTGKRIRWKELAEQYGLKFHPGITNYTFTRRFAPGGRPRFLLGPDEGSLDEKTCKELIQALNPFTGNQLCFFGYDVIATRKFEELLYTGLLSDILQTFALETVHGSPSYWWPKDHNWCLHTNWDMEFTLLGGSKELIDSILANEELEALGVEPTNLHDDTVNGRILKKRIWARLQIHLRRWFSGFRRKYNKKR